MSSIVEVSPQYTTAKIAGVEAQTPAKSALSLRSPTSPLPQFPAIASDEVNEQHQGFTVVRTGDIIEKNGTYYSSDGTVRGYSGTVRKIAQSKTLDDVFRKHKELEQLHEREYELEMQKKVKEEMRAQAAASAKLMARQTTQTPGIKTNFRNTLGKRKRVLKVVETVRNFFFEVRKLTGV